MYIRLEHETYMIAPLRRTLDLRALFQQQNTTAHLSSAFKLTREGFASKVTQTYYLQRVFNINFRPKASTGSVCMYMCLCEMCTYKIYIMLYRAQV